LAPTATVTTARPEPVARLELEPELGTGIEIPRSHRMRIIR
jgi:hypothetical protein